MELKAFLSNKKTAEHIDAEQLHELAVNIVGNYFGTNTLYRIVLLVILDVTVYLV